MALTTNPAPAQTGTPAGRHVAGRAPVSPTAPASGSFAPEGGPTTADRTGRLLSLPLIILGSIAALLAVSYLVAIVALGTVKPAIATVGYSMNPLLHQGDLVLIKATNPANVQVGDVISLQVTPANQQRYGLPSTIVHRVIAVQDTPTIGRLFSTKGDNNPEKDPFVTLADNVNGVMVAHIPKLGYPLLYIQGPAAPFLGAVLGGLIIIYLLIGWAEIRSREAAAREEVISRLASDLPELQVQLDRLASALTTTGVAPARAPVPPVAQPLVVGPPPAIAPTPIAAPAPLPAPLPVAVPVPVPPPAPLPLPPAVTAVPARPAPRDDFDPLTAPFDEVLRRTQGVGVITS